MGLDEVTGKNLSGSYRGERMRLGSEEGGGMKRTGTTIIGTLRPGEATFGPSKRCTISVEESILLFKTKPWVGLLC